MDLASGELMWSGPGAEGAMGKAFGGEVSDTRLIWMSGRSNLVTR